MTLRILKNPADQSKVISWDSFEESLRTGWDDVAVPPLNISGSDLSIFRDSNI